MKKLILIVSILTYELFALTEEQKEVKEIAKEIGLNSCVNDMCFEKTLQAIAWQESSFGKNIIGDRNETIYLYKHNEEHIEISKEETFLKDNQRYAYVNKYNKKWLKKIKEKTIEKSLEESSLGAFQIKVSTAKYVIEKQKLNKYKYLLNNDYAMSRILMFNVEFSAEIAANYLMYNYKEGLRRNVKHPWIFTVSRYNGGNYNPKYFKGISKKIKKIK